MSEQFTFPDPAGDGFVDALLRAALVAGASDLHLEPFGSAGRVRMRIDGVLQTVGTCGTSALERALGRLKVLARLVVYQYDRIQEGRLTLVREGGTYDLRVSIIPTPDGERAAVRIFATEGEAPRLDRLGFGSDLVSALERISRRRHGLLAVTGPMSSGKTTTLHALAALVVAESGDRAVVGSVEDPVERRIPGVLQVEIAPDREITFARGLSALLRQDAEVLVIGEIRDAETAAIAIDAALTGHLVLTSLHVGSPREAFERLGHLGIDARLCGSAIAGVVSQRLVRLLCPDCRIPAEAEAVLPGARTRPGRSVAHAGRGAGCEQCRRTGYRGRTAIGELVEIDPRMSVLVGDPDGGRWNEELASRGIPSLADAAGLLLERGEADPPEVLRSLRA